MWAFPPCSGTQSKPPVRRCSRLAPRDLSKGAPRVRRSVRAKAPKALPCGATSCVRSAREGQGLLCPNLGADGCMAIHCAAAEGFHPPLYRCLRRAPATWRPASQSSTCPTAPAAATWRLATWASCMGNLSSCGLHHRCVWPAFSQGVFASKHASKGIHLPAQAMRA